MKKLILPSIVFCILFMPAVVQGLDFYEPEDLLYAVDTPNGPALPILAEGGYLLIAKQPTISGVQYTMAVNEYSVIRVEQTVEVETNGMTYIPFSDDVIGDLHIQSYTYSIDGILKLSMEPHGKARGIILVMPLVNYPEGTDGYVVPLMLHDGELVIPLIHAPRGHFQKNNPHSINPWGYDYDLLAELAWF